MSFNINTIIDYECGDLCDVEIINLFAELIKSGVVWSLQGHYGRTAMDLINQDIISKNGEILIDLGETV